MTKKPVVKLSDIQYHYSPQTRRSWYSLYVPEWLRHFQAVDTYALRLKVEDAGAIVLED